MATRRFYNGIFRWFLLIILMLATLIMSIWIGFYAPSISSHQASAQNVDHSLHKAPVVSNRIVLYESLLASDRKVDSSNSATVDALPRISCRLPQKIREDIATRAGTKCPEIQFDILPDDTGSKLTLQLRSLKSIQFTSPEGVQSGHNVQLIHLQQSASGEDIQLKTTIKLDLLPYEGFTIDCSAEVKVTKPVGGLQPVSAEITWAYPGADANDTPPSTTAAGEPSK